MLEDQIAEAWAIHARIVVYILDAVEPPEALGDTSPGSAKTSRSVGDHFAHIHNVRLMWLKASAPNLLVGLEKLDKIERDGAGDEVPTVRAALELSATAIGDLLRQSLAAGGKVKGFKPHAAAFMGYLIAHESFHLGKIDLMLRECKHPVSDKAHFGMWEWGVR